MKRKALSTLRAAIEANTERRSIDELKAQGKQHVRIVSGQRVMAIIEAIVSDVVTQEVGAITERDRQRIIQRTKTEFDRVLKMQSDQETLIRNQKDMIADYRQRLEQLTKREAQHGRRVDELRAELRKRNAELDQLEEQRDRLVAERTQGDERTTTAQQEVEALQARLTEQAGELGTVREEILARDLEIERLKGERETLAAELSAARAQASKSESVDQVREELAEMKAALLSLGERPAVPDESLVDTLVGRLAERDAAESSALEDRFSATLDDTLDRITRTMEAATAKPIDSRVEATDVLVEKLFDLGEDEMNSNLDDLDVEEKTTRSDIHRNLDRLRALRASQEEEQAEKPADVARQSSNNAKPERKGDGERHGPGAETTSVSAESRKRIADSMDRLKSVRDDARATSSEKE
jgi:DNA repair exonuclease SbcCD ATPase subunit